MKPHRTDPVSLTFGLLFVGVAGFWLTAQLVTLDVVSVGWFVAGTLLVLGGIGIAQALATASRSNDRHRPTEPVQQLDRSSD